ncbi:ComEA family DNA-binding protein [Photobacterium atrarenae]|uniref:ComEA family DNA-binding protein n=1 Tax=Photobacterium atrarenae TaxID=865757 RepID=A0ABY5GEV6_9GAMM|nr:ComEA family DNA-binding protein [Photobacterium atrarenae]UTV26923.1 ComEA family DNA-binding protein [Photobacterium atrarenae]
MKTLIQSLMLTLTLCLSPLALADQDPHEGITITVNINTANAEELDNLLIGIGPDKAAKIIAYRETHGKFSSAEDLAKVKGIGVATVEKNRARILL